MLKATGTKYGTEITVICSISNGKLIADFDGHSEYKSEFDRHLKKSYSVGGTYHPPVNSLLNAKNVLENYFFDKLESISVDGEIEQIPFEENRVY